MSFLARTLVAAAFAALPAGAALSQTAAPAKEINFGVISTEASQNLKKIWDPFLADMQKSTGLKVNAFFASDYAGVIEGMRFGKVQVAWYGNKAAMEAVDRANGEIFAQSVDAEGNPGYWSLMVAHVDSPLNSLDDVLKCDKSLNLGFGDPNSTSGFLVPTTFIFAAKNITPKDCFKTVRNANHEANALAAANKQVDVAINNTENMRRLEVTNPEAAKKLKILWKSPLIPSDPLVWRKDLDEETKRKVYTFVMSYGRQGPTEDVVRAREVLKALNWAPFAPSSDAQLYPIRIMEITRAVAKIQGDDKLSADEKKAELAKLEAQRAQIEDAMRKAPKA
jgi:phosphonate transport system substrate-binding protein